MLVSGHRPLALAELMDSVSARMDTASKSTISNTPTGQETAGRSVYPVFMAEISSVTGAMAGLVPADCQWYCLRAAKCFRSEL